MPSYCHRSTLPASREAVFAWHARPGALDRLTPPWQDVRVLERPQGLEVGSRAVLSVPIGPIRRRWVAEHVRLEPGHAFEDVQRKGPFAAWRHVHRMESAGEQASVLEDSVDYELPGGWLGRRLGGASVRRQLEQLFAYRHTTTGQDLRLHGRGGAARSLHVLLAGGSGLIGSALEAFLRTGGHRVTRLVRREVEDASREVAWDPARGELDASQLEGVDAVIHLGGVNVADGRWTAARKEAIRRSRVESTALLARALAGLDRPPEVFVAASAIGFYGDRPGEELDEDSAPGSGFLPDVARAWEDAAEPAREAGIRVVSLRIGVVLSAAGGALRKMLLPFRLGLGGRIGSGRQAVSWISIDDVLGIVHHALTTPTLQGPVNAVAPRSVPNRELVKTLGRVLRRWTVVPLPAFLARLAFGEMAEGLLLASTDVRPRRLTESGYEFLQPSLEGALRRQLGRLERPGA